MHAIYHSRYKSEKELCDRIANLDKMLVNLSDRVFPGALGWIKASREELLYDLANRRDDGELRWINPGSYQAHSLLLWRDLIETILFRASPFIEKIPKYEKRLTP
jgi:hypothetical protein